MRKLLLVAVALLSISLVAWGLRDDDQTTTIAPTVERPSGDDEHAGHSGHAGHSEHAGHGGKAKRIDPGPRLLSAAARIAERIEAERAIGPEREYQTVREDGRFGILIGERVAWTREGNDRRSAPWSLSFAEQVDRLPKLAIGHALHDSMDHDEHRRCAYDFIERRNEAGSPVTEAIDFDMALHWSVRGDVAVVDDVELIGHQPALDAKVIDCYVAAFRGAQVTADAVAPLEARSFYTTWPACIYPKNSAGGPS